MVDPKPHQFGSQFGGQLEDRLRTLRQGHVWAGSATGSKSLPPPQYFRASSRRTESEHDGTFFEATAAEHRARAIEAAIAVGKGYAREGWVFRRKRGEGPLSMSIAWKAWRRLALRAGVPLVPFHALRHTCATVMLAPGVDIRTMADVLGHADVATTLRYVHSTQGSTRWAATAMGKALGS